MLLLLLLLLLLLPKISMQVNNANDADEDAAAWAHWRARPQALIAVL